MGRGEIIETDCSNFVEPINPTLGPHIDLYLCILQRHRLWLNPTLCSLNLAQPHRIPSDSIGFHRADWNWLDWLDVTIEWTAADGILLGPDPSFIFISFHFFLSFTQEESMEIHNSSSSSSSSCQRETRPQKLKKSVGEEERWARPLPV